jgi:hypothetical protein
MGRNLIPAMPIGGALETRYKKFVYIIF